MSEQPTSPGPEPVPLPGGRIPEGTAAWRTADVHRWLAAVPARWAHPLWTALVLAGAVVWAVLAMPDPKPGDFSMFGTYGSLESPDRSYVSGRVEVTAPGTTGTAYDTAAPAGQLTVYAVSTASGGLTSWWGWPTVFLGLLLLELYWIWRRPALALAVLVPLATGALISTDALGRTALPALAGAAAAAVLAAATLLHRRGVRVRQWERVAEAAGPARHPLPAVPGAPGRRPRRPYVRLTAAAVLLTVAGYCALRPTAYEGKWALLITGTLGTALLIEGLAALLRSAGLRLRPQPALRVLVREGADGRTWVYAADDLEGREPLLGFRSWGAYEGEAGDGRSGRRTGPRPLREAVLYGTPAVGAELAYVAAEAPGGRVAVEHGTTPAARARRGSRPTNDPNGHPLSDPSSYDATSPDPSPHDATSPDPSPHDATSPDPAPHDATSPDPASHGRGVVLSWSAGPVSRTMGFLFLLAEAGVVLSFLDGERGWRVWCGLLLLPFSIGYIAAALNWRVTADRAGVWVADGWRVKRLLWAEIGKVEYDDDSISFRGADGARTGVRPTGWARLDRRTARGHVAGAAAERIREMLARPELRPTADSTPREQGMPLGPVIALLLTLGAAAVLLLG
ncbi:hypothetical protein [Streptomyces sp. NPDC058657]|uniref:hypothetical protein n=1 Tax=unclassified Streptomyces TaxID=2593676 RepID=UPI00365D21F6